MKRSRIFFIALAIFVLVFVGLACGGDGTETPPGPDDEIEDLTDDTAEDGNQNEPNNNDEIGDGGSIDPGDLPDVADVEVSGDGGNDDSDGDQLADDDDEDLVPVPVPVPDNGVPAADAIEDGIDAFVAEEHAAEVEAPEEDVEEEGGAADLPEEILADTDGDGIDDDDDNCPSMANPDQNDTNDDGFGDRCQNELWWLEGIYTAVDGDIGQRPFSVTISTLYGDENPDLVVANFDSASISVLNGNGDGSFDRVNHYDVGRWPSDIAIDDFNGDNIPDIAVVTFNSGVFLLLGDETGFKPFDTYPVVGEPLSITSGRIDDDDDVDVVVDNYNGNSVSILYGVQPVGFGDTIELDDVGAGTSSVTTFDADTDGNLDIIFANGNGNYISILWGDGEGGFPERGAFRAGNVPISVAIGDLNGDDIPDLAVANSASDNISVLLGNGDRSFQAAASSTTGDNPRSIVIADANGDGVNDLIVVNSSPADPESAGISLLLGYGDGSFAEAAHYVSGSAYSIDTGDLDGDGLPDLVVVNRDLDQITIILNRSLE